MAFLAPKGVFWLYYCIDLESTFKSPLYVCKGSERPVNGPCPYRAKVLIRLVSGGVL